MTELFNVVFSGEISGRADPALVRTNVGKLFNASEAVLDKLFSGQPVAVKKMVDRATAMKVRAMMKQAGAEARMVQVDEQGRALSAVNAAPTTASPSPQTAAIVPAPAPAPAPAAGSMAERVKRMAEVQQQEEADAAARAASAEASWGVAPVGTRLSDADTGPAPVVPDVSGISIAARGADILLANEKPVIHAVQVDVSGITVAAAGTDVLTENERRQVDAVVVDISGMSMAEVGAPLDEIKEQKVLVNPDISHISLLKE